MLDITVDKHNSGWSRTFFEFFLVSGWFSSPSCTIGVAWNLKSGEGCHSKLWQPSSHHHWRSAHPVKKHCAYARLPIVITGGHLLYHCECLPQHGFHLTPIVRMCAYLYMYVLVCNCGCAHASHVHTHNPRENISRFQASKPHPLAPLINWVNK